MRVPFRWEDHWDGSSLGHAVIILPRGTSSHSSDKVW